MGQSVSFQEAVGGYKKGFSKYPISTEFAMQFLPSCTVIACILFFVVRKTGWGFGILLATLS